MNTQEIKVKLVSLFRKKTFILMALLIIIVFLFSTALLIINNNPPQQSDKTWQIELNYNNNTKKLSLEKLTVINRKTIFDQRNALYSPYKLQVLGKNGNVIFQEKINITEKILYNILLNASEGKLPILTDINSVIFVPFQTDAYKIIILRNNNTVLQINLPNLTSFGFIKSVQAAQQSVSCGPITTVFINDNYTNTIQFKSDVSYLKNLYNTMPPYNTTPSIFDFQEVDTAQNFGCASGITSCVNNLQGAIKNVGLGYFPKAQKFIVLIDNPNALTVDGGIAGLVNGIGGDVIIYTNYAYTDVGPVNGQAFVAAPHEFEGHAVGYLWDRYISSDPNYSTISPGDSMSNCSISSDGEAFWAGVTGNTHAYSGCGNSSQYAPSDPTVCVSNTENLISGGPNDSIMSAIGCSANQFDSVEKAWITNNILPNYKPCPEASTPTPTASPTSTPTPTLNVVSETPTPTPTPTPTSVLTVSPIPTPISAPAYNCVFDPAICNSGKNSIQICYLKCTSN